MFKVRLVSALLSLPLIAACSVSATSPTDLPGFPKGSGSVSAPGGLGQDAVKGPTLDGIWQSGCESLDGVKAIKLKYKFSKRNIVRSFEIFDSLACSRVVDFGTNGGQYRIAEAYADDVYRLEYNLASSDGFKRKNENVKLVGGRLYVTRYLASGSGLVPDVPLKAVDENGNPTNPPTQTSSPGSGAPQDGSVQAGGRVAEELWDALPNSSTGRSGAVNLRCFRKSEVEKFSCIGGIVSTGSMIALFGDYSSVISALIPTKNSGLQAEGRLNVTCERISGALSCKFAKS